MDLDSFAKNYEKTTNCCGSDFFLPSLVKISEIRG
jgi:hypothetical protein